MICLIAAMTHKGIIGKGNALPWNIPDELKYFRRCTQGATVIMGARTYESIGRPLPNRYNIVLGPVGLHIPGVDVCHSVDAALVAAEAWRKANGGEIFIIGGAYTYAQFLPLVDRLYISYIKHDYDGDVFFPPVDWSAWHEVERTDYPEFECVVYQKMRSS